MGGRRALTHALRVSDNAADFGPLFVELARRGERAGWLELDAAPAMPPPATAMSLPGNDATAQPIVVGDTCGAQAWKTVTIEPRRTVAVKSRRGPPVLRDLLREHFRGCRVVLVRGEVPLPALRRRGEEWELEGAGGAVRRVSTEQLADLLRSPHPPI